MTDARKISPDDVGAAVADLKRQLQAAASGGQQRIDLKPETVEQGLAKLVLTLIELLRQLLERQAIRRMEGGSLSDQEIEEMGQSLMKLEARIRELTQTFGLRPEDLNLDLGPLGNLLDK
ncbi:MAG TPA: gas vesicle protein K [Terriglobales bacterium]|nr:gas vesicle protein K [Terriglobales bacterium]